MAQRPDVSTLPTRSFVREDHLCLMPIQGRPSASCVYTCTRGGELSRRCRRAERDWHRWRWQARCALGRATYSSTLRVFRGFCYRLSFLTPSERELKQTTARQFDCGVLFSFVHAKLTGSQGTQHMPSTQGDGWPMVRKGLTR
jgi:hypothetical protein